MAPANVAPDWRQAGYWRMWPPPRNIVREGRYQDVLVSIVGEPRENGYLVPVEADLIHEPGNPHDRNAIAVHVLGKMVGHIDRDAAVFMAPHLDRGRGEPVTVCGVIRGGHPRQSHLGVHLWLDKRRSPGPEMNVIGDAVSVKNWPPREDEGQPT